MAVLEANKLNKANAVAQSMKDEPEKEPSDLSASARDEEVKEEEHKEGEEQVAAEEESHVENNQLEEPVGLDVASNKGVFLNICLECCGKHRSKWSQTFK